MYALIYIFIAFLLGAKSWWVLGSVLFLNHFYYRPLFWISFFSPLIYFVEFSTWGKLDFHLLHLGYVKFSAIYIIAYLGWFLGYEFLRKTLISFNKRILILPIFVYFLVLLVSSIFALKLYGARSEIFFLMKLLVLFNASSFVFMCFNLLVTKKDFKESFYSFMALGAVANPSWRFGSNQLGPSGTNIFLSRAAKKDVLPLIQKKAFRISLILAGFKLGSDLIGYSFLGIETHYLNVIHFPKFQIFEMSAVSTIPRLVMIDHVDSGANLNFVVFLRSVNWFFDRIVYVNYRLLFFWYLGFMIKLGVDEPWKSKSFADFYRRNHVYIAHFYRQFIYPVLLIVFKKIPIMAFKKYFLIWLMIFIGGILYQVVSHAHQLWNWRLAEYMISLKVRLFYDAILGTLIVISLIFEKTKIGQTQFFKKLIYLRFFIYVYLYSILMSISASVKLPGFDLELLFRYLEKLFL